MDFGLRNQGDLKISEASALDQVRSLLDYYQIDVKILEGKTRKGLEAALSKVVSFVRQGLLEISAPKVVQHLRTPPGNVSTIEYGEVSGKNMTAMDNLSADDLYGRIYELLGSLSGLGSDAIQALKAVDLSVAENIGLVFLNR